MNAIANEKSMAAPDPTGIGRMYGPINPPTNPMGNRGCPRGLVLRAATGERKRDDNTRK